MSIERQNSNPIDGIKDSVGGLVGGVLDKIDDWACKPGQKPWQRKAKFIILDLGLLLLVFVAGSMMIGGTLNPWHWTSAMAQALAQPGFATVMSLPLLGAGGGVGLSFLLQDILPKKAHRVVAKVMLVASPVLVAAAGVAFIYSGIGHATNLGGGISYNISRAMTMQYYSVGLLLIPLAFFSAKHALDVLENRQPKYYAGRRGWTSRFRPSRRERNHLIEEQRQIEQQRLQEEGRRRNHESYRDIELDSL